MAFVVTGISHKTAPVEVRERFNLSEAEKKLLLAELKSCPEVLEGMVISTCNRVEIYTRILDGAAFDGLQLLSKVKNLHDPAQYHAFFYTYTGKKTVRHLLRVACGLDSLIIGEKQILGQIKTAVDLAREHGLLGKYLNILTNVAVRCGKKARTETKISCGGSSVSWAAVEMAREIFVSLRNKSVLIIGAGKMSALAAGAFTRKGVDRLYVMNRTRDNGEELARKFKGQALEFWQIREILAHVDVCICSASAPHYLIEQELLQEIMPRRNKELVMIDISMPRNIDPRAAKVKGVRLVGLDELDEVVKHNVNRRQNAVNEVKRIINGKIYEFNRKWRKACQGEEELTPVERLLASSHFFEYVFQGGQKMNFIARSLVSLVLVLLITTAGLANVKQLQLYHKVFPDYKLQCNYCHIDDKPKKDDGKHDLNAYGQKLKEMMGEGELTEEIIKSTGSHEDYK